MPPSSSGCGHPARLLVGHRHDLNGHDELRSSGSAGRFQQAAGGQQVDQWCGGGADRRRRRHGRAVRGSSSTAPPGRLDGGWASVTAVSVGRGGRPVACGSRAGSVQNRPRGAPVAVLGSASSGSRVGRRPGAGRVGGAHQFGLDLGEVRPCACRRLIATSCSRCRGPYSAVRPRIAAGRSSRPIVVYHRIARRSGTSRTRPLGAPGYAGSASAAATRRPARPASSRLLGIDPY